MTDLYFAIAFSSGALLGLLVMWICNQGRITDYQEQISNLHSIILSKKK